jgi:membrane protein implicated in regulation of membrane protease activity
MDTSTLWWILTGVFVAAELLTGTFYLLMLALGLAAGAVCAHLGFATTTQLVIAALVGASAVLAWYYKHPASSKNRVEHNPNVHLDIGSTVNVETWTASGGTSVMHRGALWSAKHSQQGLQADALFTTGLHRVVAVDGNTLVLSPV